MVMIDPRTRNTFRTLKIIEVFCQAIRLWFISVKYGMTWVEPFWKQNCWRV